MQYDLETMTHQEVFDAVCKHLLTQKRQSKANPSDHSTSPVCRYRSFDGLKCAAGIFVPDHIWSIQINQKPWDYMVEHDYVPPAHDEFIISLQYIHDVQPISEWKRHLYEVAQTLNLQFNYHMYNEDKTI